jgi:hypothetical protein
VAYQKRRAKAWLKPAAKAGDKNVMKMKFVGINMTHNQLKLTSAVGKRNYFMRAFGASINIASVNF